MGASAEISVLSLFPSVPSRLGQGPLSSVRVCTWPMPDPVRTLSFPRL